MQLVTYRSSDGPRVGVRTDGGIAPTDERDMRRLIADGEQGLERARAAAAAAEPIADAELLAPIARPEKILGSGINYTSHGDEDPGAFFPERPFFFSKLPSAVIGPDEPIVLPCRGLQVDYEVELAAVIGRRARYVSEDEALAHVFGYTLMHDVSSRAVQFREEQPGDRQITLGKSIDGFAPLGPQIVTADEIPDPATLHVRTHVNGELRQDSSVGLLRFDVAQLIAWLSTFVTLEPGDVISTGTPAGGGAFADPATFLEPGDVVVVSEPTIGELRNPVIAGPHYDELPPWPYPWTPPHPAEVRS